MPHHPRKRFGQNFLVDESIINRIVDSINPQYEDRMIEIGPGPGAITCPLLSHLKCLDVIELDRDIIPLLVSNCNTADSRNKDRLIIHNMDALNFDFTGFHANQAADKQSSPTALRIVGNLPYNISTPILFHLLASRHIIQDMHFMLQKEVVDRIVSLPGNKQYGRLSVMIQTFCTTQALFTVPSEAFKPAPRVESAVLRLQPGSSQNDQIDDFMKYEKLVRLSFAQRRKTLKNTLKDYCSASQIEKAGLSPGQRAEELSIDDFVSLYKTIN